MKKMVKKFLVEETGQGMTEYGLILGLIAVVVVGLLVTMGTNLKTKFQEIVDSLKGGTTTP